MLHPMKETLFDEKICGSIHLTPGMCYEDAPNGNESAVHWDLALIQRADYGGGEIWFDGELIREGRNLLAGGFTVPESGESSITMKYGRMEKTYVESR